MTQPATQKPGLKPGSTQRSMSLVPAAQAPLRTLVIAMTVMCFLSSVAVGTLLLIDRAVDRWTSQIAGQATLQVIPQDGVDTDAEADKAHEILEQFPGIASVELLSKDEAMKLLEPWLGRANVLEELPIPRLLAITTDRSNPPDLAELRRRLDNSVKGAVLDTHRHWQDELTAMAATLTWLGIGVLAIICAASVALVIYATRTSLESNRETIEVLYLVGARDSFITSQVERRFLIAGMRAGLAGMAAGLVLFGLFIIAGYLSGPSEIAREVRDLLLSTKGTSLSGYALFGLVPVLATLISLVTARLATARILREIF